MSLFTNIGCDSNNGEIYYKNEIMFTRKAEASNCSTEGRSLVSMTMPRITLFLDCDS